MKLLAALVAFAALVSDALPAAACATAPPRGEEARIADEEAVIPWDPATQTETFIRRASFRSTAKTFGFLVPTPTTPKLGEASDALFSTLADKIQPDIVTDTRGVKVSFVSLLDACMAGKGEAPGPRAPPRSA